MMTGLIILLILIPIILFVILFTLLNRSSEQQKLTETLYDHIKHLSQEIRNLSKEIKDLKLPAETKKIVEEEKTVQKATSTPIIIPSKAEERVQEVISKEEISKPIVTPEIKIPGFIKPVTEIKAEEQVSTEKGSAKAPKPVFKKETDLEKFIGENLAAKVGIAVLVLGISFLVKYAIDEEVINETGRVVTGLVAGSVLLGIAHRIRNTYRSFSSVLVGGGLTVFYFTIAFAFHQYQLISQTAAFIIMIIITAVAVLLSLYYDRLELAILATIGGFITPFLVSTGQANHVALFSYLCILNSGMMALAWFKRWPTINMIALLFTTVIYTSWLIRAFWLDPEHYQQRL